MYSKYFKRILDIVLSLVIIILTLPVFIIVSSILLLQNKGKVFFIQKRPGKNEKPFYLLKFKTMADEKDENGNLLPDVERITKIGNIIRKFSIDELPQLFNILKGDMSIVGPRPLLFKYIPLYSNEQKRRHLVKPGITGLAQVNGRNSISWKEKFEYDIYYIDNLSFYLDIKIIFLTIVKILKTEGINQSNERPMMPFNGKN